MRIMNGEYPPNYAEIIATIPAVAENPNIVFTYGTRLYVPGGGLIPSHLKTHEEKHVVQQMKMGVDRWWSEYLINPSFRLEQELWAYRAQYRAMRKKHTSKFQIEQFLLKISKDLSGEMYGNIVDSIKARKLITGEEDL